MFGKILADGLLEEQSDFHAEEWNMSSTKLEKSAVRNTINFLEYSKILHKVQEFFEDQEYSKVVDILNETISVKTSKTGEEDETWMLRLFMLIESLWELEQYEQCLEKAALALAKAVLTENTTDLQNILATIDSCFQILENVEIAPATGASLCDSLISIMLGQVQVQLISMNQDKRD